MTHASFKSAVAKLLKPVGFESTPEGWIRTADGYQDFVSLQTVSYRGTTVNIYTVDLECRNIFKSTPPEDIGRTYPVYERIGALIDERQHFWRRDANEPEELTAAIEAFALPFLERMHTIEGMKAHLAQVGRNWQEANARMHLAILCWRTGDSDQACELLGDAPRAFRGPWLDKIEALRRRCCAEN